MENIYQDFLLFASFLSGSGVLFFLGLIWKHHKSRVELLKRQTFQYIQAESDSLDKIIDKLDKRLKEKIDNYHNELNKNTSIQTQKDEIVKEIVRICDHLKIIKSSKNTKEYEGLANEIKKIASDNERSLKKDLSDYLKSSRIKNNSSENKNNK